MSNKEKTAAVNARYYTNRANRRIVKAQQLEIGRARGKALLKSIRIENAKANYPKFDCSHPAGSEADRACIASFVAAVDRWREAHS